MSLIETFVSLRNGANTLSQLTASQKNLGLLAAASSINNYRQEILEKNQLDIQNARQKGMTESLIDRLTLTNARIDSIIDSIHIVANSEDPIGSVVSGWNTPEGLHIKQIRVPLGVAAIIYESRPNVTADAFALAYKSGNAILLRGSSSAINSNKIIVKAIKDGLASATDKNKQHIGVIQAIELAQSGEHSEVDEILEAKGYIDVVLPRGGAKLIKMVVEKAKIPVIETGSGICHLFIDESADINKGVLIAENAKLQRPGVCNAIETLLIHKNIANEFLPQLIKKFDGRALLKCCQQSFDIINTECLKFSPNTKIQLATEQDYFTEHLDNILSIKIVNSLDEAITHINTHNTKHSESIITNNIQNATKFQNLIDASCVYVNASTRFTDGGVFGYGAELGISTQKFHVRGPMGLTALTTTKYLINGEGNIR